MAKRRARKYLRYVFFPGFLVSAEEPEQREYEAQELLTIGWSFFVLPYHSGQTGSALLLPACDVSGEMVSPWAYLCAAPIDYLSALQGMYRKLRTLPEVEQDHLRRQALRCLRKGDVDAALTAVGATGEEWNYRFRDDALLQDDVVEVINEGRWGRDGGAR